MSALICGSMAIDTIMTFPEPFSDSLLADQLHNINVCFLVPTMRREFGGCAGNIAYNLKMLGGNPVIMATVGMDGEAYLERLGELQISSRHIQPIKKTYTAQAYITTDQHNNQITAFHPGAMNYAHYNHVTDAGKNIRLAIVAPDGREGMLQHARDCAELGIPLIFDPGQGLPMFNAEELRQFVKQATYLTVNDYEANMLIQNSGWSLQEIVSQVKAMIITQGENGATLYTNGKEEQIPCVKAEQIVDPTGCGDAFRGGLMYGLLNEMELGTCVRLGNLMGALKIAHQGGQNHMHTPTEIADRFYQAFGYRY